MSGYRKGTRKSKPAAMKEFNIGGFKVSPALLVSCLLAALYGLFLFGSQLEKGTDSLILGAFSLLAFAVFAFLARDGGLPGLRPFLGLIDAFLALSALTFIWDFITYFNILNVSGILAPAVMSVVYAVVSVILIGVLLWREKTSPEEIFIRSGDRISTISGMLGLVVFLLLGFASLYFLFGGSALGTDKLALLAGVLLVFSLLAAAYEEAWFRGLLLSRLEPLAGETKANVIQALAFGVFEAFIIYTITSQLIYLPVVFVLGSVLGYYLGRMVLKDESIVSAVLYHAGFYMLVGMPLFAGLL